MTTPAADAYDVILVGSGMGALTVASLLAKQRGKRVLVLERHFKLGGYTHEFRRGSFRWDVGVHYVGDLADGGQLRRLFDLVTDGDVAWTKMPDPFERFVYPDLEVPIPSGRRRFVAELVRHFPEEERALRRYVGDLKSAVTGLYLWMARRNASRAIRLAGVGAGLLHPAPAGRTTKHYLDAHFRSPQLKAVLASQWGDLGLPPGLSAFAAHALIATHYLRGGWYPRGGAGRIAESVKKIVEAAGGTMLVRREVTRILVEGGRAVGVEAVATDAAGGVAHEIYRAPTIISDAGAATTWLRLVPDDVSVPFRDRLRALLERHPPATNVTLFVGLEADPRTLGVSGENLWLYADLDHDGIWARRGSWLETGRPELAYVSFPSLKDPDATAHTAEVIAMADYESFRSWREEPWRRRGPGYEALKDRLAKGLVEAVEKRLPGFAGMIARRELATPLTNEHFTGHHGGGIYGIPGVPERFGREAAAFVRPDTPLPGLFLTGADAGLHGVAGALMSGLTTAGHIPDGISFSEALRKA